MVVAIISPAWQDRCSLLGSPSSPITTTAGSGWIAAIARYNSVCSRRSLSSVVLSPLQVTA